MIAVLVAGAAPPPSGSYLDWLTATHLAIIGVLALLTLVALVAGARRKARRKAADRTLRDHAAAASTPIAQEPPAPPPEPLVAAPPPVADAGQPATPVVPTPPPVAPAPPPLSDAPVPGTPPAPAAADDLTRMKGVGPKLAARLGDLGYTRFEQIAALDDADAAALDAQLGSFAGRLGRDRWVEQAGYLARDDRAGFEAAFGRL